MKISTIMNEVAPPIEAPSDWAAQSHAPTWAVIGVIHAGWLGLMHSFHLLPWWVVVPIGAFLIAWHGSMQHELIHGHPTRHRWLNAALGSIPLSLWLPFAPYRDSHLEHHRDRFLTDPFEDPESYYLPQAVWAQLGPIRRAMRWVHQTFLGRVLFGPPRAVWGYFTSEALKIAKGDFRYLGAWTLHAVLVGLLLSYVKLVCGVPIWKYLLFIVYPGIGLGMVRSYTEHRVSEVMSQRTAIVEAGFPFGLLFLHNNLHLLHHEKPGIPWYQLPEVYRQERDGLLARNGGFYFHGYAEVFWKFALRPKDAPVHPRR